MLPSGLLALLLLFMIVLAPDAVLAARPPLMGFPADDAPVRVVLTDGTIMRSVYAQPAPFDMVRVRLYEQEETRHVPTVRIHAIVDFQGRNRTALVLNQRETLGTPPPRPGSDRPPRPLRVGPRSVRRSFLITETTLLARAPVGEPRHREFEFAFDVGIMKNASERTAVGYFSSVETTSRARASDCGCAVGCP